MAKVSRDGQNLTLQEGVLEILDKIFIAISEKNITRLEINNLKLEIIKSFLEVIHEQNQKLQHVRDVSEIVRTYQNVNEYQFPRQYRPKPSLVEELTTYIIITEITVFFLLILLTLLTSWLREKREMKKEWQESQKSQERRWGWNFMLIRSAV